MVTSLSSTEQSQPNSAANQLQWMHEDHTVHARHNGELDLISDEGYRFTQYVHIYGSASVVRCRVGNLNRLTFRHHKVGTRPPQGPFRSLQLLGTATFRSDAFPAVCRGWPGCHYQLRQGVWQAVRYY